MLYHNDGYEISSRASVSVASCALSLALDVYEYWFWICWPCRLVSVSLALGSVVDEQQLLPSDPCRAFENICEMLKRSMVLES
jgi:hypothetical protein